MRKLLHLFSLFLTALPIYAQCIGSPNCTVKAGGGGNYTTISNCAAAMAPGDTCTVFAGTYNENVTVPAGSVGSYKTITVNGSDIVSVLGFTLNSHTKLIGNCPTKQGTVTTATCGFFISNTSSPTTNCITLPNSTTDVFIRFNTLYACGGIGEVYSIQVSFIFIQGNTVSYTNSTVATVPTVCNGSGNPVGNSLNLYGNHFLVENNDFSHYTLSLNWNPQNSIARNNSFHDTTEVNNTGNCHSDTWFADPGGVNLVNNTANVYEGNVQRNAVGPNAKGPLFQAPSCAGCNIAIVRFNVTNRIGSGSTTNDQNWQNVKVYNNTTVDANYDAGTTGLETDNSQDSNPPTPAILNQIYYYTHSIVDVSPGTCGDLNSCNFGHNLAFCTAGCGTIYGHHYQLGLFTADPGNKVADPKFVNYIGVGNAGNDFHLQSSSPAIAAGTFLTTANGSGSISTALIVNDASYFQDGYGLSNPYSTVQGDCISVTTVGNHVCVTAVNYSTNTLTLASPISWTTGDHIWLYSKSDGVQVLTGSAPDMGAFPFSGGPPVATFTPSSANVGFVPVGLTSNPISVTLQNTGSSTLTNTAINLSNSLFTIVNNTCGSPATITNLIPGTGFTLAAGASCTFGVTASPVAAVSSTANAVFTENTSGGSDTLVLNATGTGPPAPAVTIFAGNMSSSGTVVVK